MIEKVFLTSGGLDVIYFSTIIIHYKWIYIKPIRNFFNNYSLIQQKRNKTEFNLIKIV